MQRLVRISISAARLFRSQFHNVFSSAESGRISGQADLHIFRSERPRSPAAPCAPYGGTPCWAVHLVFGCSALAHCSQCDSVVAFLCIVDVEGPVHVRQPVIHMPNVRVLAEARFGADSQEPLVRPSIPLLVSATKPSIFLLTSYPPYGIDWQ